MPRIIQSHVATGESENSFKESVSESINLGYQPQGGISTTYCEDTHSICYSVLMVKFEDEGK